MSADQSDYLKQYTLEHVLQGMNYPSPSAIYLALYLGDPGGIGSEVTGGSYVRQAIQFTSADGIASNSTDTTFPTATADWGSITHWALFTEETSGNMLYYGTADYTRTVTSGNNLYVGVGDLTVDLNG